MSLRETVLSIDIHGALYHLWTSTGFITWLESDVKIKSKLYWSQTKHEMNTCWFRNPFNIQMALTFKTIGNILLIKQEEVSRLSWIWEGHVNQYEDREDTGHGRDKQVTTNSFPAILW